MTTTRQPGYYRVKGKNTEVWDFAEYTPPVPNYPSGYWQMTGNAAKFSPDVFERLYDIEAPISPEPPQMPTREELIEKAKQYMKEHGDNIPGKFFSSWGDMRNPFTCWGMMADFVLSLSSSPQREVTDEEIERMAKEKYPAYTDNRDTNAMNITRAALYAKGMKDMRSIINKKSE